jgi:hypothetical protein
VKDVDLIICHPLLGNYHFFTPIYDEIATLIKLAVFTGMNAVILVQTVQLTELRAKHDWYLANHNSGRIKLSEYLFDLSLALPSLLVHLVLMSI